MGGKQKKNKKKNGEATESEQPSSVEEELKAARKQISELLASQTSSKRK